MSSDTLDYKDTLNLPVTDFPMRAGLPAREPDWLARWERIGVYDRLRATAAGRPPFVLHDGPPYANGNLHIGHALNKVLKDMIVRSHQMMGYDARYVPGWDCHGLPIEWKIEEKYRAKGLDKDAVPVVDFRRECRDFAAGWIDIQRAEFKRLGITGAWDRPYLTMDYHAERVIAAEFMTFLMNKGAEGPVLYQGSKPVMWSPVEKTALAEAEVEYHDRQTDAIWVKFPLSKAALTEFPLGNSRTLADGGWQPIATEDGGGSIFRGTTEYAANGSVSIGEHSFDSISVVIWTTTPWTIPSNRAVCYGRAIQYSLYRVEEAPEGNWTKPGEGLVIADSLAEEVLSQANVTRWQKMEEIQIFSKIYFGETGPKWCLDIKSLYHPFVGIEDARAEWDYEVPMLPGDHVTDDAGTGFVHTAPSHGDDDYAIGRAHNIPMTFNILDDSSFRPDLPFFAGERVIAENGKPGGANKAVIAKLVEVGALLARKRITISDAHSWRSKAPVIRLNRPQWFAAIDRPVGDGQDTYGTTIRERALTSIDQLVTWTPRTGRNRLYSMIEARPDWVLSRQRAWGVPLTCFTRRGAKPDDADFLLRDPAVNARILAAFEAEGADAWYMDGAKERFLAPDHNPDDWDKVDDILDVWFDSGSTHAFVLRDRDDGAKDGIADLYLEGTDQHRGWFHSSMLQACGTKGRAPYRAVLTHGFTLDEKGMKMSKSLGNTVAPADVIQQYGADILRLWVAQADYTADLRIGPEILKGVADAYRRLRNTLRFLLGSLGDYRPELAVDHADMPELERYVLHLVEGLDRQVKAGYAAYDFQGVFQKVFQFATVDLSALYFDIRKDALYCDGDDSLERRAALTVLDILFHRLTGWLAPVLVFTMEEVWLERFPGDVSSIHLQDMPDTPAAWHDPVLADRTATHRAVRRVVTGALEDARRDKVIGASLEAAPVVHLPAAMAAQLDPVKFATLCIVSDITLTTDPVPAGAFTLPDVPGVGVVFARAAGQKCQRCWKVLPDVGTHAHADVCGRCNDVLAGQPAPTLA